MSLTVLYIAFIALNYIFSCFIKNLKLFFITGLALSFFSGVYGASIGFTNAIGRSAKQLVGLNGVFLGVGEVLGGVAFGLLGKRSAKWGRDPIVIIGFIIHIISYFLVFMNLPDVAVFGDTDEVAYFNPPIPSVAMLCSFLLGLGDACFNTQIYSMLGGVFAKNSAEAFSIFKFSQVTFDRSPYCRHNTKVYLFIVSRNSLKFCIFDAFRTTCTTRNSASFWNIRYNEFLFGRMVS